MSKLMTLSQAHQILDDFADYEASYDECRAEAGMGAVSMGYDGYDGMALYDMEHERPQPDAEVLEAREVARIFSDLKVFEPGEFGSFGRTIVPEYSPRPIATDDIPF